MSDEKSEVVEPSDIDLELQEEFKKLEASENDEARKQVSDDAEEGDISEFANSDGETEVKQDGVLKRINKLTAQKKEAQEQALALQQQVQALEAKINGAGDSALASNDTPKPSDFDSNEQYVDALIEQKFARMQADMQQKEQLAAKSAHYETRKQKWQQKVQKAHDRYDDFEEAFQSFSENFEDNVELSEMMADFVSESEYGPDLAVFLGRNEKRAKKIADLGRVSPALAIKEISSLEVQLQNARNKNKNGGTIIEDKPKGGFSSSVDPSRLSPKEYAKWRDSQR